MNNMHCLRLDFLTRKLYKCLLQIIVAYIEVAHEDNEDFKTLLNFQMGYGTSLYESGSHIGQGSEHEVDIWHTIAGHVKEGLEILCGLEMTQVL